MKQTARRKVLVVCLGNPDRGDDGVGLLVAKKLAGLLPTDVAIASLSGDILSLMADWAGFDAVICIDAAAPLSAPGRIHRVDLATSELPRNLSPGSSHALGLGDAIALARVLQTAPRDIMIYAVEGAAFDGGAPMTPEVAAAVDEVAACVVADVERLRQIAAKLAT